MAQKLAGIIGYAISIVLMLVCLFIFKKKAIKYLDIKFFGMSAKTIIIVVYVGIYIDAFVIVMELVK